MVLELISGPRETGQFKSIDRLLDDDDDILKWPNHAIILDYLALNKRLLNSMLTRFLASDGSTFNP